MKTACLFAGVVALSLAAAASAQMDDDAPEVGDVLPDVSIYDDAGKPFHTAELRGRHAVIVFGCLT